jgi:hypothetical protein
MWMVAPTLAVGSHQGYRGEFFVDREVHGEITR